MGEVIRFDFNKNKKIENEEVVKSPEVLEMSDGTDTEEENLIKENDIFFRKFAHFVLSDRHKKFKNLEVKQMPYESAQKLVNKYTNEQLLDWMTTSDESEWVVRPSFYKAIYNEIKSRLPERYYKK